MDSLKKRSLSLDGEGSKEMIIIDVSPSQTLPTRGREYIR